MPREPRRSYHKAMPRYLRQLLAIVLSAGAASAAVAQTVQETQLSTPQSYLGRQIAPTMSADGAEWLVRNSREEEEQPRLLLDTLELKAGQRVCDFGCGNGYYSLELAQRVGPTGEVWAIDIQQEMLDLLQQRAKPLGLDNIRPILAEATDPHLPAGEMDLVLMVDVYHELSHPVEVLRAVRKSLRPMGRLVLVEFRAEDHDVPILPLHKMSQKQVMKELTANEFKLVGQFSKLPWQHVFFFADARSPVPAVGLVPWRPGASLGENLGDSSAASSGDSLPATSQKQP
jgi:2-polyprenyl-3-methyl-5-hydroxy-6-metoxy-1,4-benzoquinol methylase